MKFSVSGELEVGISKANKPYGILRWVGGKTFVQLPVNVHLETLPKGMQDFHGRIEVEGKEVRFRLEL